MVDFVTLDDVLCFLVYLIADGLRIVARRGDKEIQRLHTGVTGAFRHDIKELAVRLGVQLIEHNAVGVETVLVADIGGEHLVDTSRWLINEPLLGIQYLDPLGECRTHSHHIRRHIENDGLLSPVGGTSVHLGTFLTVAAGKQERHRSGKLGFALLLRNFDVCRIELPIAVRFEDTENVSNDLLLPVDKLEGLSRPGAFGVAQALDEHDGVIGSVRIVAGVLGSKLRRFIFLQLTDSRSPPSKKHKKRSPQATVITRNRAVRLSPKGIYLPGFSSFPCVLVFRRQAACLRQRA